MASVEEDRLEQLMDQVVDDYVDLVDQLNDVKKFLKQKLDEHIPLLTAEEERELNRTVTPLIRKINSFKAAMINPTGLSAAGSYSYLLELAKLPRGLDVLEEWLDRFHVLDGEKLNLAYVTATIRMLTLS